MPRLIAATAVVLACLSAAGCGGSSKPLANGPVVPAGSLLSRLDVKIPAPARLQAATPPITLHDSTGRLTSLAQFKGKAVLLTFLYTHCPDACPLIVANLHNALLKLGPQASNVQIVAVSVDPRGDTAATVNAFLAAHEMTGRMEYLIGSFRQLAPIWKAWGIEVHGSPDRRETSVGHSVFVLGITGRGKTLVLYPPTFEPSWLVHDVPILASA